MSMQRIIKIHAELHTHSRRKTQSPAPNLSR